MEQSRTPDTPPEKSRTISILQAESLQEKTFYNLRDKYASFQLFGRKCFSSNSL